MRQVRGTKGVAYSLLSIFYVRSELLVFGSGVALVGVQLTEYTKLFLSRWIGVAYLIGNEHLKTGVLLDFFNLGTGV